jgi:hypothetical protein
LVDASFEERFERMVQWSVRKDGLDRPAAEEATRAYVRTMPLWRDRPRCGIEAVCARRR